MADTSTYPAGLDGDLRALVAPATTPSGFEDFMQLVADAVAKIETELGVNPSGASATVAAAIAAVAADLAAHEADTADAHDASAISIVDTAGDFTAIDVEGALAELQTRHETDAADLAAHLADTSDAHDASAVSFSPVGTVAATDVQAAIAEVASESAPLVSPALTGVPTAPTAAAGTNTTQIATTAHVRGELAAEVTRADGAYASRLWTGFRSGRYYRPAANQQAAVLVQNRLTYVPFPQFSQAAVTFDRIGCSVTTAAASSTIRLGIFAATSDGYPGSLVLDAGTVDSTTTGAKEITISTSLPPGLFFLCGVAQGGAPSAHIFAPGVFALPLVHFSGTILSAVLGTNPGPFYEAGVSGALPAAATPSNDASTVSQAVGVGLRAA